MRETEARQIALAQLIATLAHEGQVDKAGFPYILHPAQVAERLRQKKKPSTAAICVGWLHDVIEDTEVTYDDLLQCFPHKIAKATWALTRLHGQTDEEYYATVKANPLSLLVKTEDLGHNTEPARLERLPSPTQDRLKRKYRKARRLLGLEPDPYLENCDG